MEINNFSKLKGLFSIDKDDMRSVFFLLATSMDIDNLYSQSYMINMKTNEEWIIYCKDLMKNNNYIQYINYLNSWEIDLIKRLCRVESYGLEITDWTHATRIYLDVTKFEAFTQINYDPNHIISNNKQFEFNESILNAFLVTIMKNTPALKEITLEISPIKKCFKPNDNTYFNTIKCAAGNSIDSCVAFMNQSNYNQLILDEVASMDMCDAAKILVKFGFKNNNVSFESYESWETRIKNLIHVTSINPKLKKYIELLLDHVNPIMILKRELQSKLGSSVNIFKEYLDLDLIPYEKLEINFHQAYHIIHYYSLMMKAFSNQKIFNYDNMYKYRNYYEKINYKYLLQQKILLDQIEENITTRSFTS
jgi:hypothetical protein